MGKRTLTLDDKPSDVLEEHVHTYTAVQADPLTASYAAGFDALITGYTVVTTDRIKLVVAIGKAKAGARYIDGKLDVVAALLANALDKVTDKSDPRWQFYLEGQDLSVFTRPVLSKQLAKMALWPGYLAQEPEPELVAVGVALAPLLAPAKLAADAIDQAEKALEAFDTTGAWAQYIEASNAARDDAYGAFADIPHQNSALKLPKTYADGFFLHDTSRRGAGKPRSAADLDAELKAAKATVEKLGKDLAAAQEREAQDAAEAKALAEKEAALAALKQKKKEDDAEKKQLEKEIKKGKKKK
jgi:hypothetical protein